MTYRMLDIWAVCPLAEKLHPDKPRVQLCQISWMKDYWFRWMRCSICLKAVGRRPTR